MSLPKPRTTSLSQASEASQTAADFIKEQLSLEAEAREALPYQFDTCTRDLGPLRQGLYSCLDCNPPPVDASGPYVPAAVCYACSISCHGEHSLVELFSKRNFVCDCGTTRLPESAPCALRLNLETSLKGGVVGQEPARGNHYNHNFRNMFCGCNEEYDPHQEKGIMFQCLGLGTVEQGGCGEDWWHPECLAGFTRDEYKERIVKPASSESRLKEIGIMKEISFSRTEEDADDPFGARRPSIVTAIAASLATTTDVDGNDVAGGAGGDDNNIEDEDENTPPPPGFPHEDSFEHFLCYKCVQAFPWIKRYAGAPGFLPPVHHDASYNSAQVGAEGSAGPTMDHESRKRKASGDNESNLPQIVAPPKRQKSEDTPAILCALPEQSVTTDLPITTRQTNDICKLPQLSDLPNSAPVSLFMQEDFRAHLCRCRECFPLLKKHPQLLEDEDVYEPPISEDGDDAARSVGTGSLLDRGEVAFNNMDRVRAIQGAMAYAHLKDGLKTFLRPYAETGQVVGAEDIKAYFEKLRGDEAGIKEAAGSPARSKDKDDGGTDGGDHRKEQSGY